jgi:hypothetical protein
LDYIAKKNSLDYNVCLPRVLEGMSNNHMIQRIDKQIIRDIFNIEATPYNFNHFTANKITCKSSLQDHAIIKQRLTQGSFTSEEI